MAYIARVVLFAASVWDGFARAEDPRITWIAVGSTSTAIALLVLAWLSLVSFASNSKVQFFKSDRDIDWSDPYSFTKPFFPPTRYPVRFCVLLSLLLISTGLVSSTHDTFVRGGMSPSSGMFLFWGISGIIPVLIWIAHKQRK